MTYASEVLADSPLIYWRLGESSGTSAADNSGNGHAGTYVNAPTLGVTGLLTGDSDTAVLFDELAAGMSVDSDDTFGPTTYATFAFECLADLGPPGASATLCMVGGDPFTSPDFLGLFYDPSGPSVQINFQGTSGSDQAGAAVTLGVHHLVGEFNGTEIILYVDGVVVATEPFIDAGALLTTADQFIVGNQPSPYGVGFSGTIDEAAFYTHALGPTRVAAHHAAAISSGPPPACTNPQFHVSAQLLAYLKITP